VTGNASWGYGGNDFPVDKGWNVGALLNIPVFSGYLVRNQVAEAKANLEVVKSNEELLKQQVRLEVEQAYSNMIEAAERIVTAQLAIRQAEDNLELANGRYATGVGNPIEVTDALVAVSSAKISYISGLTDYKTAQASLEKAMGMK
jgi:outer membrane protein TolC